MGSSSGKKSKKVGRNVAKCALYRQRQRREKNWVRKCKSLLHRLEKRGIRPADQEVLKKKIIRMQRIVDGLPAAKAA